MRLICGISRFQRYALLIFACLFSLQGYTLEDATGLSLNGDIDIESIFASSLPNSHPSFAPERYLEMSEQWRAPPLPTEPVELFIGILSAARHFAERMAVRKSWMMYTRKSSNIVARFFVALVTTLLTHVFYELAYCKTLMLISKFTEWENGGQC
jgi:hypothetical protein